MTKRRFLADSGSRHCRSVPGVAILADETAQVRGGFMFLGTVERKILVELQVSEGPQQVTKQGMSNAEVKTRIRSTWNLHHKGLVNVERRLSRNRWPRRIVLWAALTPLGETFVEIFGAPLRSGGRIRSKRFEMETGQRLPTAPAETRVPMWLEPYYAARRRRRDDVQASTTPTAISA